MSYYPNMRMKGCVRTVVLIQFVVLALDTTPAIAADVLGRLDTTHAYADDLFPAPNIEVALRNPKATDLAGHGWTGPDGRYVFRSIPFGGYTLFVRPDSSSTYDQYSIQVGQDVVAVSPIFLGDIALASIGGPGSGGAPWKIFIVASRVVLKNIECVEYRLPIASTDRQKRECNGGDQYPFSYIVPVPPTSTSLYFIVAQVRFKNGAFRLVQKTFDHRARSRVAETLSVVTPPCSVFIRLVDSAKERDGMEVVVKLSAQTKQLGTVERSDRNPTREVLYRPPSFESETLRDSFTYTLKARGEDYEQSGGVKVTALESLRPGCPKKLK